MLDVDARLELKHGQRSLTTGIGIPFATINLIATQRSGILKIVTRLAKRKRSSSDNPWNCVISANLFSSTGSVIRFSEMSVIAIMRFTSLSAS
jgi:hypothetical protein